MNVIELEEVRHRYRNEEEDTLCGISFGIGKKDIFGLLGPNGAGKTTLISIMTGIFPPSAGEVRYYEGKRRLGAREIRRTIGYVPQEYAFYQELTPRQNLAYFGALYDLPAETIRRRSGELMEVLGLSAVTDKKIATFSGGMKRRVNLAIGILHEPEIVFLDEPTVGVDVQSKHAIIRFLKRLNENGMTVVYTSHHLAEAEEICNRVAFVDHGKIIASGSLPELLLRYRNVDLQSLFLNLTGDAYRD